MNNKILDSLRNIIHEVNNASDFEQALNIIVKRTRDVMCVDSVSVYFLDDKTKKLILMDTDGLNPNAIGKIRFNIDQGLVGLVFDHVETVNIKDAHTHPNYRFVTETDEQSFHGFLVLLLTQIYIK